jgi:hypothetical protein
MDGWGVITICLAYLKQEPNYSLKRDIVNSCVLEKINLKAGRHGHHSKLCHQSRLLIYQNCKKMSSPASGLGKRALKD